MSALLEGDEVTYQPNSQAHLVIVHHELSTNIV